MNEKKEQLRTIIKMVIIVICAGLYAWGGMEFKFLRRFIAPSILGASCLYFTRDWKSIFKMPLFMLASCLGYGADITWVKIFKRSYVGLTFGLGASIYEILKYKWLIVSFSIILCISAYVVFGVWNPFGSARIEESILGLFTYTMAIMPLKRKDKDASN